MSADMTAQLDAMQARCDAATPGNWAADGGWLVLDVGRCTCSPHFGAHERRCGTDGPLGSRMVESADAEFIAAARSDLPRLIAAVRAVLELHRRVSIYDECECTDEQKAAGGHKDIYEVGTTCNRLYDICGECCRDDVYQREDCAEHHEHTIDGGYCPTVTALTAALDADS